MGFLKSFMESILKVGESVDNALQDVEDRAQIDAQRHKGQKSDKNTKNGNLAYNMEYFRMLFREEFPDCTIEENVSAESMGWSIANKYKTYGGVYPCRDYEFLVYKEFRPVLTVLLTDHNKENLALCKNTIATSEENGVRCLNFLMQMPNEREYVTKRIKAILE